jgi:hypothetical protein
LLALAALSLFGTAAELALLGHFERGPQLIPFGMCAAGIAAILGYWLRPGQSSRRVLRAVMVGLVVGSVMGVVQHVQGNIEILLETQRNPTPWRTVVGAATGASPLLAPGVFVLIATLTHLATVGVRFDTN